MIKNFDEIKDLLATERQGFDRLIGKDGCLCIQAVFATAWGFIPQRDEKKASGSYFSFAGDDTAWTLRLPDRAFEGTGLKSVVDRGLVAEIDLEPWQRVRLDFLEWSVPWTQLNDELRLTFAQFGELLDLIERQEAIND
jgi:hypothetical protein